MLHPQLLTITLPQILDRLVGLSTFLYRERTGPGPLKVFRSVGQDRGYSLIEMVLVCALVGFLANLGFSSLRHLTEENDLWLAADSFLSTASTARFLAVARNLPVQIAVHPDHVRFTLVHKGDQPRTWNRLPGATRFTSVPQKLPTFYSRGLPRQPPLLSWATTRGKLEL